jgi:hypothetical protein
MDMVQHGLAQHCGFRRLVLYGFQRTARALELREIYLWRLFVAIFKNGTEKF